MFIWVYDKFWAYILHHDYTERKLASILTCIRLPDSRNLSLSQLTTAFQVRVEEINTKQVKENDKPQKTFLKRENTYKRGSNFPWNLASHKKGASLGDPLMYDEIKRLLAQDNPILVPRARRFLVTCYKLSRVALGTRMKTTQAH